MSTTRAARRHADDRERRRARVSEMMLSGWRHVRIAAELGVSPNTVGRDVRAIRQGWHERTNRSARRWLDDEVHILVALRQAHLPAALAGDRGSTEVCLAVGRDLVKLLGLQAPTQIVLTPAIDQAEIERLERELGISPSESKANGGQWPQRALGPGE